MHQVEWPCNKDESCFRVLDGDVIVFKPREWRGTSTVSKYKAPII